MNLYFKKSKICKYSILSRENKIEYVLSISNDEKSRANKFARSCVMEKKNNWKISFSNNYSYFWLVPYSRDTSEKSIKCVK